MSSSRDHAQSSGSALDWRDIACRLWMLLDDIDTASDVARADDHLYREMAERTQQRRHAILDGFYIDEWHAEQPQDQP